VTSRGSREPLAAPPIPNNITQDPVGVRPSEQASRRLWTAGSITALSACGARLPALSVQGRAREAPYSRISPQALSNLKSPFPLPPSRQNTTLRSRPCPAPSRRPPIPTGLRPQHHPHISKTTFRHNLFPPCHRHHLPPDCSRTTGQPRPGIAIMARPGRNSRSNKDRMIRLTPSSP